MSNNHSPPPTSDPPVIERTSPNLHGQRTNAGGDNGRTEGGERRVEVHAKTSGVSLAVERAKR